MRRTKTQEVIVVQTKGSKAAGRECKQPRANFIGCKISGVRKRTIQVLKESDKEES